MLDSNRDFALGQVAGLHTATDTSIPLLAGHGARFPDPVIEGVFTAIWWNITDFRNPADDPNREWVRGNARSVDTLTVTRGVDGTPATTKNLAGKTYAMMITYSNRKEDQLIRAARGSLFLFPHEQTTPNLTLFVRSGIVYVGGTRVVFAGGNSPTFTAPTTNPRIDLLTINSAGVLERIAGTEAVAPTIPAYPTDRVVICEVFNRVGQTTIRDVDTAGQGFIQRDVRPFLLNPPPAGITSGWELIRTGTFTGDTNITGLDGDVDRLWMLVIRTRGTFAHAANITFNNDMGLNYSFSRHGVGRTAGANTHFMLVDASSNFLTLERAHRFTHHSVAFITPLTGQVRAVSSQTFSFTDVNNYDFTNMGGGWNNTTANITILGIHLGATILSGEFFLFRRR